MKETMYIHCFCILIFMLFFFCTFLDLKWYPCVWSFNSEPKWTFWDGSEILALNISVFLRRKASRGSPLRFGPLRIWGNTSRLAQDFWKNVFFPVNHLESIPFLGMQPVLDSQFWQRRDVLQKKHLITMGPIGWSNLSSVVGCGTKTPGLKKIPFGQADVSPEASSLIFSDDCGVQSPPQRIVLGFHYHSQEVSQDP